MSKFLFFVCHYRDKCFDTQEKSVPHNKVQKTHNKVQITHNKSSKNTQ